MDLNDFLDQNKPKELSQNKTQVAKYDIINLGHKNNLGTLVVKPVLDIEGMPFRKLEGVYEGSISSRREDGSEFWFPVRLMNNNQYKSLNQEELRLLEECRSYADIITEMNGDTGYINKRKEVTIFYGIGISLISNGNQLFPSPSFHLFRHNSANLLKSYYSARKSKNESRGEMTWINRYYEDNNTHLLSIMTQRGNIGFDVSTSFDIDDMDRKLPHKIDYQDSIKSLRSEFIDYEFDSKYHTRMVELMKLWINSMTNTQFSITAPSSSQPDKGESFVSDEVLTTAQDSGSRNIEVDQSAIPAYQVGDVPPPPPALPPNS